MFTFIAFVVVAVTAFVGGVYAHKAVAAEAAKVETAAKAVETVVTKK